MYVDLSCHGKVDTNNDIREAVFTAAKYHLNGVSLHPYFFQDVKDFVPKDMVAACPIDIGGCSDPVIRQHAVIAAIRKGANTIDLVANNHLLTNCIVKYYEDIETIYNICKDNNIVLRVILEYRLYVPEWIIHVTNNLREMGVEYIIPATGEAVDAWDDNLAISIELTKKAGMKVITNGNIWNKKQYIAIKSVDLFGVRLNNKAAVSNIFA